MKVTADMLFANREGIKDSRPAHLRKGVHYSTDIGGKTHSTVTFNKEKTQNLINNLALIRETFGTNISESIQLCLTIVANAVRERRLP